jgi:hypothetical protein
MKPIRQARINGRHGRRHITQDIQSRKSPFGSLPQMGGRDLWFLVAQTGLDVKSGDLWMWSVGCMFCWFAVRGVMKLLGRQLVLSFEQVMMQERVKGAGRALGRAFWEKDNEKTIKSSIVKWVRARCWKRYKLLNAMLYCWRWKMMCSYKKSPSYTSELQFQLASASRDQEKTDGTIHSSLRENLHLLTISRFLRYRTFLFGVFKPFWFNNEMENINSVWDINHNLTHSPNMAYWTNTTGITQYPTLRDA